MQEIDAEGRRKLKALEVYRVRVSDQADLTKTVAGFAADSRVKFMEMKQVMSVPTPIEEGQ